jgi:hypothetical protein
LGQEKHIEFQESSRERWNSSKKLDIYIGKRMTILDFPEFYVVTKGDN